MKHISLFLLFLFFSVSVAWGQTQKTPAKKPASPAALAKQYENLKARSNSYVENGQTYKVIHVKSLDSFWENIQASMQATQQQLEKARAGTDERLTEAQEKLNDQEQQILNLKKENELKEQAVQQNLADVANISVFGLDIPKQVYVIISLVIAVVLLILAGIMFSLYNGNKRTAVEKQKAFEEIERELTEHKKAAREKELKLKRELQTEMNRVSELTQQLNSRPKSQ